MDPADFYRVACDLPKQSTDESYLRTSVGRGYYACFHLAKVAAEKKWSWVEPGDGRHRALVRLLKARGSAAISDQLRDLLDMREHADYHLDNVVDPQYCEEARQLAEWLVPRLVSLGNVQSRQKPPAGNGRRR